MAKKKKTSTKTGKRIFILGFLCIAINLYVGYSLFGIWKNIYSKKEEKKELAIALVELKDKEEALKVEVNKLNDPAYVAKYAREKFFYSGNNEYIIKIE